MDPLRASILFMALFIIVDYANGCGPAAVPVVAIAAIGVGMILNSGCGPSPQHGAWGRWSQWSGCLNDGSGTRVRHRSCNNPAPAHGGNQCGSSDSNNSDCNECLEEIDNCEHLCRNKQPPDFFECDCFNGYKTDPDDRSQCIQKECRTSDWSTPPNAQISQNCRVEKVRVGTICWITCNHGFQIEGNAQSKCTWDSQIGTEVWSPRGTPNCRIKRCTALQTPDKGAFSEAICTTMPQHGQDCSLTCDQGYEPSGPRSTKCDDGSWTIPQASLQCRDIQKPSFGETCPPQEKTVFNDRGNTTATVYWDVPEATDNSGYVNLEVSPNVNPPQVFRPGRHLVMYTARDDSGNEAFCHLKFNVQVLRCPVLQPPTNAKSAMCDNFYGSICRFECEKGYELKGSHERSCNKTLESNVAYWTGNTTYCEVVKCLSLKRPDHAWKTGFGCNDSTSNYGTTCFFDCFLGYEKVGGKNKRTCREDRTWSGSQLQCKALTCRTITIKSEGLIVSPPGCTNSSAVLQYAAECQFSCHDGYQLYGPGVKTCAKSKKWLPDKNPSCKDVMEPTFHNCTSNSIIKTAGRSSTSATVNWIVPTATDNSGITPIITHFGKQPGERFSAGEHTIRYLASDGSGNVAECNFKVFVSVVRCVPRLYAPLGGTIKCTKDNMYGSECSFKCHIGYTRMGSANRRCEKNQNASTGYWTGNETHCKLARCSPLSSHPNTVQSGCGGGARQNVFGDKCLFHCNPGYRQLNGSNETVCQANGTWSGEAPYCQVVRCQALKVPKNGSVMPESCTLYPKYGDMCHITCGKGYRLHGEPVATCLDDGEWSVNTSLWSCRDVESPSFGLTCPRDIKRFADKAKNYTTVTWGPVIATDNSGVTPKISASGEKSVYYEGKHLIMYDAQDESGNNKSCKFYVTVEVLQCQILQPPINGFFVGDCGNMYGSMCRVRCNEGYNMLGPENVTCEANPGDILANWDVQLPICEVRRCSSLEEPKFGFVYPHMCKSSPISGTTCIFECRRGFRTNGGESLMHCGNDGKWNKSVSSILKCLDASPPIFSSCPSDIRASLSINSSATVNWTIPIAVDNSEMKPIITVSPLGAIPPYTFHNSTLIVYTAIDAAGNKDECSFKVTLEDNSGPVVVYCPADQNKTVTDMRTRVRWNSPEFKDNSNSPLNIKCSHESNDFFYWGTWNVYCTAFDNNPNNNPAVCQFTLRLKPKECTELDPPLNGATACDAWALGRFCSPFCNDKFDFARRLLTSLWVCGGSGNWQPRDRWPDCTKLYQPNEARMAVSLHYYNGNCSSPETQAQIQQNFIEILNGSLFNAICRDAAFQDKCKAENVKVTCSVVDSLRQRKKRASDKEDVHNRIRQSLIPQTVISLDIVVLLNGTGVNDTKETKILAGVEGIEIAKNISSELRSAVDNGSLSLTVEGMVFVPDKQSLNISKPERSCGTGQSYRDGYCVSCNLGTYLNKTTGECEDCPLGTYQDQESQEKCVLCPPKTSTEEKRTYNRSGCIAFCKAGSVSPTGMEPCFPCEKGYYQELEGKRLCTKCIANTTTSDKGSSNLTQCKVPCSAGSFSPSGLVPCSLCSRRSFQPRIESRTCISCPGTTITMKSGSKSPQDCIEINECESSPCRNNSTCTDLIGDFLCTCQPGYTGKQCEINIDDCQDQPCFNNGTCYDLVNNYTCRCAQGYQGFSCEDDIDECISSPCFNNATCINLIGGYICQCKSGYKGRMCDVEIDECLSLPCQNGATCRDKINHYECLCPAGYQGNNCEENIDDCASDPCKNEAQCVDGIAGYHCICPAGFNGTNCEHDIDECMNVDCQNNATCLDQVNGFYCICYQGFTGKTCEVNIDDCVSDPCKNEARCVDEIDGYHCDCKGGFDGILCEINIDDCASNPCSNNGSCHDGVNNFTCVCPSGFTGSTCSLDIDYCASMPCLNNASCFDGLTSFTCQCPDGFSGDQCQHNIDDCQNVACFNGGTCMDGIDEYTCLCPLGFTGFNCEINIDECGQNPCLNDGTCTDLINDFRCTCDSGYTGRNCSVDINECLSSPCQNKGTCTDHVDSYTCDCIDGFSGQHCEVNVDDCLVHACANGSTCMDGINSYTCVCPPGFRGKHCQTEVNECESFPCLFGGTCYDQINAFYCACPFGFTGQRCEVNIDDCQPNPCMNNGKCTDLVANYSCSCPAGFTGFHCDERIDYCKGTNCTQNGICVNLLTAFICNCSVGYYGKYCEFEIDECSVRPCFNNATCHDGINSFSCSCREGYTGRLCELDIDECFNNSCQNNATCIDKVSSYTCLCADGFNGTFCQTEINECDSNPCENNSTCVDETPGYRCMCSSKHSGKNCQNLQDVCSSSPCKNGGTCLDDNSTGTFNCSCKAGFTGETCDTNIDDCASMPCTLPNSYCADLIDGFKCVCYPSHTGDSCEIFLGSNFDLIFKRLTADDMVLLSDGESIPNMRSLTIGFFVRADYAYKSGTLFSYSVPNFPEHVIILSFSESKVRIKMKHEIVSADFRLADGLWHFVGVIWNGINATVTLYIDGFEKGKGSNVLTNDTVIGGGWFVLGQRYLAEERNPILSTAFVGTLHQFNFWNVPAMAFHMWNAAHNCTWAIAGSVRAWSSFISGIKGKVEKRFKTQCKAMAMCTSNCSHFLHCESRQGFYYCICQAGFTGFHCNINIDDCIASPCLNGRCVDGVNRYDCICDEGYWGTFCEKKIDNEKECPKLPEPKNGKKNCEKVFGIERCTTTCNEGNSFTTAAMTKYTCGPDTDWKWNGIEKLDVPACSKIRSPNEIEHHFSVSFPGIRCGDLSGLHISIEQEVDQTLSTIPGCVDSNTCEVKDVSVPGCGWSSNQKTRRSVDDKMKVLFSLSIKPAHSSSLADDIEERSEAILFQMQFAVSTGQFNINLNGVNSTADRSSFEHLSSNITCRAGFVSSSDHKTCVACPVGTFHQFSLSTCTPCSRGTYQDEEGQLSCKPCGVGKTTPTEGASSITVCDKAATEKTQENSIPLKIIIPSVITTLAVVIGLVLFCRFCGPCAKRRVTTPTIDKTSHYNEGFEAFALNNKREIYHVNEDKEPNYCEVADVPKNIGPVSGGGENVYESLKVINQQSVV